MSVAESLSCNRIYIAGIAPARYRGRLVGLFQFNIVLGIVIAYVSNALLAGVDDNAWRWMMGVAAVPSLIYAGLCLLIAERLRAPILLAVMVALFKQLSGHAGGGQPAAVIGLVFRGLTRDV